jgi:hypothetical protein
MIVGLLICTLISDLRNQRLFSNPRKVSGSANPDFFYGLYPEKSWVYTISLKKIQVSSLKTKSGWMLPYIFFKFRP